MLFGLRLKKKSKKNLLTPMLRLQFFSSLLYMSSWDFWNALMFWRFWLNLAKPGQSLESFSTSFISDVNWNFLIIVEPMVFEVVWQHMTSVLILHNFQHDKVLSTWSFIMLMMLLLPRKEKFFDDFKVF